MGAYEVVIDEMKSIKNRDTDFMADAGFGIFVHYLEGIQNGNNSRRDLNQGKITSWDQCVHDMDVDRFAGIAEEVGAGYVIFTLQQQFRFMCAPNSLYDFYTGYKPGEACSTRDIVSDLYEALKKKDIKLMLYSTGEGPALDEKAVRGLPWTGHVDEPFMSRWYGCMKEYSDKYGSRISGWWIDGCYPGWGNGSGNLGFYSAHLKSGNPDAVVAFNAGVRKIDRYVTADDYTCGERTDLDDPCDGRWINGCQWHCLTYLGKDWAYSDTKYTDKQLIDYVRSVKAKKGAITLDIGLYRDGSVSAVQIRQLSALKKAVTA
jgi:hypothetical protein